MINTRSTFLSVCLCKINRLNGKKAIVLQKEYKFSLEFGNVNYENSLTKPWNILYPLLKFPEFSINYSHPF